ncbi:MAG: type 1 glutamine amidotransferase [Neisseriaceae bacterium]|nr:type 1 glutamine amidotransferase [Neisseriaceae bacterium]
MADSNKKVLVISSDYGTETAEILETVSLLKDGGVESYIVSTTGKPIQTLVFDKDPGPVVEVSGSIDSVNANDYAALVIPGGTINADNIRVNEKAISLVKEFNEQNKPIAAICHAPWLLIEAGIVNETQLTSYKTVSTDLKNAGADWVDKSVVVDTTFGKIITSRSPDDISQFTQAIITSLKS